AVLRGGGGGGAEQQGRGDGCRGQRGGGATESAVRSFHGKQRPSIQSIGGRRARRADGQPNPRPRSGRDDRGRYRSAVSCGIADEHVRVLSPDSSEKMSAVGERVVTTGQLERPSRAARFARCLLSRTLASDSGPVMSAAERNASRSPYRPAASRQPSGVTP